MSPNGSGRPLYYQHYRPQSRRTHQALASPATTAVAREAAVARARVAPPKVKLEQITSIEKAGGAKSHPRSTADVDTETVVQFVART